MLIKGTAILARRDHICRLFGEERWRVFMNAMARRDPVFSDTIYVTSKISLGSFLGFQERLVETFFPDEEDPYYAIGEQAAQWAFTDGPYARILDDAKLPLEKFLRQVPAEVWAKYYDFGAMRIDAREDVFTVVIDGLPEKHEYFERTVAGFMVKSAEMIGGINPRVDNLPDDRPGSLSFRVVCDGWSFGSEDRS